jgi:hypothetical protein
MRFIRAELANKKSEAQGGLQCGYKVAAAIKITAEAPRRGEPISTGNEYVINFSTFNKRGIRSPVFYSGSVARRLCGEDFPFLL